MSDNIAFLILAYNYPTFCSLKFTSLYFITKKTFLLLVISVMYLHRTRKL